MSTTDTAMIETILNANEAPSWLPQTWMLVLVLHRKVDRSDPQLRAWARMRLMQVDMALLRGDRLCYADTSVPRWIMLDGAYRLTGGRECVIGSPVLDLAALAYTMAMESDHIGILAILESWDRREFVNAWRVMSTICALREKADRRLLTDQADDIIGLV